MMKECLLSEYLPEENRKARLSSTRLRHGNQRSLAQCSPLADKCRALDSKPAEPCRGALRQSTTWIEKGQILGVDMKGTGHGNKAAASTTISWRTSSRTCICREGTRVLGESSRHHDKLMFRSVTVC
nr:hypothetical protein CFP56_19469 [Quercus suber]